MSLSVVVGVIGFVVAVNSFESAVKKSQQQLTQELNSIQSKAALEAKDAEQKLTQEAAEAEQKVKQEGSAEAQGAAPNATAAAAIEEANGASVSCDSNISVNSVTSCPFGDEVFKAYAQARATRGSQATMIVTATSPTTAKTYSMTCVQHKVIACTGGNHALVTFPLRAIEVY